MLILKLAAVISILFGAGVATSYAEYRFQYSLFQTVAKLFGKKF